MSLLISTPSIPDVSLLTGISPRIFSLTQSWSQTHIQIFGQVLLYSRNTNRHI